MGMNATQLSTQSLAAQAAAGDRQALEALCEAIWPDVRRLCLVQLGEVALAEDATQESLVAVVRHIHRYDSGRPFGPWLRTLVRNQCRTAVRKLPRPVPEQGPRTPPGPPDRAMDLDRAARTALEAFATLTPRQREVIDLCDCRGLAPSEAADQLDIARGTARALLHQARTALRTRLLRHRPELLDLVTR